MNHWQTYLKANTQGDNKRDELKIAHLNLKLSKSILLSEPLPQELLTETPIKLLQHYVEAQQAKFSQE